MWGSHPKKLLPIRLGHPMINHSSIGSLWGKKNQINTPIWLGLFPSNHHNHNCKHNHNNNNNNNNNHNYYTRAPFETCAFFPCISKSPTSICHDFLSPYLVASSVVSETMGRFAKFCRFRSHTLCWANTKKSGEHRQAWKKNHTNLVKLHCFGDCAKFPGLRKSRSAFCFKKVGRKKDRTFVWGEDFFNFINIS